MPPRYACVLDLLAAALYVEHPDMARDDEISILAQVISALKPLEGGVRTRLLQTIAAYFRDDENRSSTPSQRRHAMEEALPAPLQTHSGTGPGPAPRVPAYSNEHVPTAKEFLHKKEPVTDVERVLCLGYYLTHYKQTALFKTVEISKLNTEAAQPKFSNASVALDTAVRAGYVALGGKGSKQLTAYGERYVEALPDRDAARQVVETTRLRRKGRTRGVKAAGKKRAS